MLFGFLDVFVVIFLIMLNGLFAMSELAVIASRKVRLQQRAEEGDARAGEALDLAGNPQRFLSTIQIGITLVGVLSGAFGGARLAKSLAQPLASIPYVGAYSDSLSLVIVVGIITYLSLLAELFPKRLALSSPEEIASSVAKPMKALSRIAWPAIYVLSVSTEFLLRLVGSRSPQEPAVTEEEIRRLLGQATHAGVFHEAEQEMVERVFRLGDRRVGVMMTPRNKVEWLDISDPPEKIRRRIARSFHSRLPVAQGRFGNIIGIVHVRELAARCLAGKPFDLKASVRRPLYVHENAHALGVLELFRKSGLQMALVVDEYGTIEGIVTLSDILEAIVGDIPSAGIPEEPRLFQRDAASWLVDGMLPIDELKDHLHVKELPGESVGRFQTMSGFAMTYLKRIPVVGDKFECCGYRFEVVDMDGHRVDKVLIENLGRRQGREFTEEEQS